VRCSSEEAPGKEDSVLKEEHGFKFLVRPKEEENDGISLEFGFYDLSPKYICFWFLAELFVEF